MVQASAAKKRHPVDTDRAILLVTDVATHCLCITSCLSAVAGHSCSCRVCAPKWPDDSLVSEHLHCALCNQAPADVKEAKSSAVDGERLLG